MEYFSIAESVNMMKKLICSTLAVGNVAAAIAGITNVTVDFSAQTGKDIKPLHGINNSPVSLYKPLPELQDAGIPYVRLHDTSGAYGGNCYVDVPNIFPDFDANENDPSSYRFEFTDAYLKQLNASGMKIFYRLGVTIENHYRIHAYRIAPPKDFAKWARICEHIIRHYNEGWANGFHYNIQYWEIWNEPENPPMWSGTREQFFELYRIASTHLKKCFPQLKIGGYASCGFLALTNPDTDDFHKSFLTWFEDFLKFAKKHDLPLDFFSWHKYFNNARQLIPDANYVRQTLDKYGFTKTESIFNEWNYYSGSKETVWDDVKNHRGASTAAEAFIRLQQLPVDKAMYYDATPTRVYCGLYYFPHKRLTPCYYSFKAFNCLYQLKKEVSSTVSGDKSEVVAALAASDGKAGAALITNADKRSSTVKLNILNAPCIPVAYITDRTRTFKQVDFSSEIRLAPFSTLLLDFNANISNLTSIRENQTVNFSGIDNNKGKK